MVRVKASKVSSVHVLSNSAGAVLDGEDKLVAYCKDGVPQSDSGWDWVRNDCLWSKE